MLNASLEVQAYYAARAPYYDAVYLKPERQSDIKFLAKHLQDRFDGRSVLEVACGTGYWTQYIALTAASLVATDVIPEPLSFARMRPGTEQVSFKQADAYSLPESLGEFNAAFAGLWFSHVPISSRQMFLSSMNARLSPGARVILLDNGKVQLNDFPITEADSDGNTYQLRELRDGSIHKVLKNFPSETEMQLLLQPYAEEFEFMEIENFWLCEFKLREA